MHPQPIPHILNELPNKSIVDLSEGTEFGAELAPDLIRGPDSATPQQAHACLLRGKPSLACGRFGLKTFPKSPLTTHRLDFPRVIRDLRQPRAWLTLALSCALFPSIALAQTGRIQAVQWTTAQQSSSGIRVQRLTPVAYVRTLAATASVQNSAPLLQAQADVASADAAWRAAQARLQLARLRAQRAQGLYMHGQNVALAEVQQDQAAADEAQAGVLAARAALDAARVRQLAALGPALEARLRHDPALRRAIATGRMLIVDLTLPPGAQWPPAAQVRMRLPATAPGAQTPDGWVPVSIVGPAATASSGVQGLRDVGVVAVAGGLMPGLHLAAEVRAAAPVRGVLVPASSVVWAGQRALVFVTAAPVAGKSARTFTPRPVSTAWPLDGGYVQPGWNAIDVVTRGAGLLLTPPPKPQAKQDTTADGDDD